MGKGGGGSTEVKETSQEKAAAIVANEQWSVYKGELRPFENMFMDKVDALNDQSKYDKAAGTTNLGYQQSFGQARQQATTQMAANGADPNSGNYQGALKDLVSDQATGQADTTNRAQTSQQDKYVAGLQDVVALGAGQKADALSGYNNIASHSLSKATSDAQRSLSDRQAIGGLVGAGLGAAARTWGPQGSPSIGSSLSSFSNGVFGGGNQDPVPKAAK